MAHIFNYAVFTAIPDPRRGERVNVGVAVFLADRVDLRFPEVRKIRVLQNGYWERHVSEVQRLIEQGYSKDKDAKAIIERLTLFGGVIRSSELAWFSIDRPEQYEGRVEEILSALVERPRPETRPPATRLNTEIAGTFRRVKLLAKPSEGTDVRKVHRNFVVSTEDDLAADFGFRNGVTPVIATLELRQDAVDKGRAALKAITLDRARKAFGDDARRIAVYAAPRGASQFRPHIHMLSDYANATYNWEEPRDRERYLRVVYAAIQPPPGMLNSD
jgi:hypothetical protein